MRLSQDKKIGVGGGGPGGLTLAKLLLRQSVDMTVYELTRWQPA